MAWYSEMSMQIQLIDGLPFFSLIVWYQGKSIELKKVLIDTGSASTILKLDVVEEIGLTVDIEDMLGTISGVGGSEFVFFKTVEALEVNRIRIENFQVNIGVMDYGFEFDGIVGMDYLLEIKGIIDLNEIKLISKR